MAVFKSISFQENFSKKLSKKKNTFILKVFSLFQYSIYPMIINESSLSKCNRIGLYNDYDGSNNKRLNSNFDSKLIFFQMEIQQKKNQLPSGETIIKKT